MSLFETLQVKARAFPGRRFLIEGDRELSYRDVLSLALVVAGRLRELKSERLYLYAHDSVMMVVALFAADLADVTVCVLNRRDDAGTIRRTIDDLGDGFLLTDHVRKAGLLENVAHIDEMAPELKGRDRVHDEADSETTGNSAGQGSVVVLTTGTTGQPKAALYSWARLVGQVRKAAEESNRVWLLTYPLNHFAGIQMMLHSVVNGHALVIPASRRFEDVEEAIHAHCVDSISGTPTFWRMFLGRLKGKGAGLPRLKQITLGGEASTPELLADLKRIFPQASITQVYATTELGACFAVGDGKPGFPASFLERNVGNVRLKIVDGELYVQSENRMLGYVGRDDVAAGDDWIATGDMVELVGERVYFRGRKSEIINVGGYKVHPGKVEAVILQVDGVQGVRVFGKSNPITGQLVAATLQASPGVDHSSLVSRVRQVSARHLGRAEQPREINITEALEQRNGKIVRSQI